MYVRQENRGSSGPSYLKEDSPKNLEKERREVGWGEQIHFDSFPVLRSELTLLPSSGRGKEKLPLRDILVVKVCKSWQLYFT